MAIKRIKPILSDIHRTKKQASADPVAEPDFFKQEDWVKSRNFKLGDRGVFTMVGVAFKTFSIGFIAILIFYAGYLFVSKEESINSARSIYGDLRSVASSLRSLDTDAVPAFLQNINTNISSLRTKTKPLALAPILNLIPNSISEISSISNTLYSVNGELAQLKANGFTWAFNDGEKFVSSLKKLAQGLDALQASVQNLRNNAAEFDLASSEMEGEYLKFVTDLERGREALRALIDVLDTPGKNHFLILFENPTEIRPSGGFFGSYGDLVIEDGQIRSIEAQDIYYPERFSDQKLVPPMQLQGITTKWGPQDAAWFFDFPTSARKVIEFLEESSVYEKDGIQFRGAISINFKLIEDILRMTGGIDIPEYNLTLTSENFLAEIQREVETGRDKKPGQNPKRVLKYVTPILLDKLGSLSESDKAKFLQSIQGRYAAKDIKLFFEDPILESLVTRYGGAGEVYRLPADFAGDYLAVVNANIAGGKSDKFIAQKINIVSKIDQLGVVSNELSLTRTHSGQNQKDWWYRATNQNYVKIFVPPTSRLQDLQGASIKNIVPAINYAKSGYKVDPDLDFVERTREFVPALNASTYKESGKNVFAAWLNVPAGKTGTLKASYANSKRISLSPGTSFQFIFDKQSGVESEFSYTLEAPSGFQWKESKSPIFQYVNTKLPARVIINLTLEKE